MSKVEKIESELKTLSERELEQVRDWLDNFMEDRLEFTEEFESGIRRSEEALKRGEMPRTRQAPVS